MCYNPQMSCDAIEKHNYGLKLLREIKQVGVIEAIDFSLLLRRFVFRMAMASAKQVTGDEPQGTMGLLPAFLCAHIERDVWVRGRIDFTLSK